MSYQTAEPHKKNCEGGPRQPMRRGFLLIPMASALALLALSPTARAVSPPPDGGYPGGNTAVGNDALKSLILGAGTGNTATGAQALFTDTTGNGNTATGTEALFHNIADNNTATGALALFANTSGSRNTATGVNALGGNQTGNDNTAFGADALEANQIGTNNTAVGARALFGNTGNGNTAAGGGTLGSNTTGSFNTATGVNALVRNTTGSFNIALGLGAGFNLTTGSNNIDIGNPSIAGESNTIRIGTVGTQKATFIAGIRGATVPGGIGVVVGPNGQLGTFNSSERFKEAIKPMGKASEAVLALKPVTFRYKHKLDPEGIPQFGLVAEQVEKVNPDLVARDSRGKVITVRYEAVNAMLLNEFLKEHRKVQDMEAALARQRYDFSQQQKEIKVLVASLKQQALQVRKVSAQLEVSKAAPQMAVNYH